MAKYEILETFSKYKNKSSKGMSTQIQTVLKRQIIVGGALNSSEEWFQNTAVSVSGFTGFL